MIRRLIRQRKKRRISGYERYLRGHSKRKKALLSYLVEPVLQHERGIETNRFSNNGIAITIPRALNELGYSVDIVDWEDSEPLPDEHYDLVIQHAGKNFHSVRTVLTGSNKLIYFSTGNYWRFHNEKEEERLAYFEERHGVRLKPDRYIEFPEEDANSAASGIIALGDPTVERTYAGFKNVRSIDNASYPDDHFLTSSKDFETSRKNLLFFAGGGNIHKGLDLVIDALADAPELNLYIMTSLNRDFARFYRRPLRDRKNIFYLGMTPMRSAAFYEVADRCAFSILPSCSEGQAGSIVETMNQGLIPVVTPETRLDTGSFGITLHDLTVGGLTSQISQMVRISPADAKEMSLAAREAAVEHHSPSVFLETFKRHVEDILSR